MWQGGIKTVKKNKKVQKNGEKNKNYKKSAKDN